jgi:hypothetical protein
VTHNLTHILTAFLVKMFQVTGDAHFLGGRICFDIAMREWPEMNPGATEETGKVATAIVESLKNSPLTLAMVVFNIIFVIVVYMGTRQLHAAEEKMQNVMMTQIGKMADQLYNCVPAPK